MLTLLLLFFTTALTLFFIYTSTPLPLAALLVAQTFLIALSTYITSNSSWFSFILLMIFLSAMMIIFIYVSSLAPNEAILVKNTNNILWLALSLMLIMFYLYFFSLEKSSIISLSSLPLLHDKNSALICYKIYSSETSMLTLFLIIYLFICLIVVVKNATNMSGPLRIKK